MYLKSGAGGAGAASFRREKYVAMGGPDGGDGGKGGSIFLEANENLWTLLDLRYQKFLKAENGNPGARRRQTGKSGKDIILKAPPGTVALDEETGETVGEVTRHGERILLLPGGKGGAGNWHFRSSINQAPERARAGQPGLEMTLVLELKTLADVGLVGFPNAGKSTLLSVLSAAKPKIADYAFTTLVPNVGVVRCADYRSFVMADIPGIIEGAHEGKGLGDRFLRHIERNAVLLFMLPVDSEDIVKEYRVLRNELRRYAAELSRTPHVVAVTKCDLADEEIIGWVRAELEPELEDDVPLLFISSAAETGLDALKNKLLQLLTEIRKAEKAANAAEESAPFPDLKQPPPGPPPEEWTRRS